MKRRTDPTDPLAWLARAKSNLRIAELGSGQPGIFLEDLCFDAQQAAERVLGGALCAASRPWAACAADGVPLWGTAGPRSPAQGAEAGLRSLAVLLSFILGS